MMTVSRALSHNSDKVSKQTRDKILAIAKHRKVEVNHVARSLAAKRVGNVGIVTPFEGFLGSEYFARIIQGVHEVFSQQEWGLSLFDTRAESQDCGELLDRYFRQRRVDGFLIISPTSQDDFVKSLGDIDAPTVLVGELSRDERIASVDVDPALGLLEALLDAYSLGHRRFGFLYGPEDVGAAVRRRLVYEMFVRTHDVECRKEWCVTCNFSRKNAHDAAGKMFSSGDHPTALFCANDLMALGAFVGILGAGHRVPKDVSLYGFDNISEAQDAYLPLTTVSQPIEAIGSRAAQILRSLIEKKDENELGNVMLPSHFVPRLTHGNAPSL